MEKVCAFIKRHDVLFRICPGNIIFLRMLENCLQSSCRNLIRYTRRGKIQRVECSISGLSGCIGSEECKFCLKKNESK